MIGSLQEVQSPFPVAFVNFPAKIPNRYHKKKSIITCCLSWKRLPLYQNNNMRAGSWKSLPNIFDAMFLTQFLMVPPTSYYFWGKHCDTVLYKGPKTAQAAAAAALRPPVRRPRGKEGGSSRRGSLWHIPSLVDMLQRERTRIPGKISFGSCSLRLPLLLLP